MKNIIFIIKTTIYIGILSLLLFPVWMVAQNRVKVTDMLTRLPISYATVYFPDTKASTITDAEGFFYVASNQNFLLVQLSPPKYKTFLQTIILKDTLTEIFLEPSTHDLQEVVVSGSSMRLQGENVLNVEKLSLKNNPESSAISLSEKLAEIAGLSQLSSGTGIGKPVIRGMSGNRIALFSQGVRIENQQWGDEHGLGLDENGYEQVEIIKGAASLLYGSDALGGVLFFIDERYAADRHAEIALSSEYHSNTNGWRTTGGLKLSKNQWHWNIFGGYTTHQDYKDGKYQLVPNTRFRTGDLKTTLGFANAKIATSLKYSFLNEQYGLLEFSPDSDFVVTKGRKPDFPFQNLFTHIISTENSIFFNNHSKLKFEIGYVLNMRQEFEEETDAGKANLDMLLGTLSYNIRWYSQRIKERWNFIAGTQGMYQHNMNRGEELLIPNAFTAETGLYAMSDFYYTKASYWQLGLRIDGRHISGKKHGEEEEEGYFPAFNKNYAAINFSTGIFQQLVKKLALRFNLASGYRAPNMFELLSNGVHEGVNRYERGDINLKTENSYQAEMSLNYEQEHVALSIDAWTNYIRHYIYLHPTATEEAGIPVYDYNQIDALLYGGEARFHLHPHPWDWLHIEASYSNVFAMDIKRQPLPLMPAQKISALLRVDFSWKKAVSHLSIYVQNRFTFAQRRITQDETTTPAYNLLNAGFSITFRLKKQSIALNMSMQNILNTTYFDHLSRYKQAGIFQMGRNFTCKITIPLAFAF